MPPWARQACQRLDETGLPHRRVEAWRTTDPEPFLKRLSVPVPSVGARPDDVDLVLTSEGQWQVAGMLPDGVCLLSLEEAVRSEHPVARAWIDARSGGEGLSEIVRAHGGAGGLLDVRGVIDRPLKVRRLPQDGLAILPVLLVHLAPGASLVLDDTCVGAETMLSAGHGVLGADARLHWIRRVPRELEGAWWCDTQAFEVAEGARLAIHDLVTGAAWHRQDLRVSLTGEAAELDFRSLLAATGSVHGDIRLEVRHLASGTTSRQVHRGLHGGAARGIFTGLVHVPQGVGRIRSDQELRALMLSQGASALCQPQLEILADDVSCSHGATVGQLAEEALFYLRARGLDQLEARALLAAAFAAPAMESLPAEAARVVRRDLVSAGLAREDA